MLLHFRGWSGGVRWMLCTSARPNRLGKGKFGTRILLLTWKRSLWVKDGICFCIEEEKGTSTWPQHPQSMPAVLEWLAFCGFGVLLCFLEMFGGQCRVACVGSSKQSYQTKFWATISWLLWILMRLVWEERMADAVWTGDEVYSNGTKQTRIVPLNFKFHNSNPLKFLTSPHNSCSNNKVAFISLMCTTSCWNWWHPIKFGALGSCFTLWRIQWPQHAMWFFPGLQKVHACTSARPSC